jgi:hypothetical protein
MLLSVLKTVNDINPIVRDEDHKADRETAVADLEIFWEDDQAWF